MARPVRHFDPNLCCEHRWSVYKLGDDEMGVTGTVYACDTCGASCSRDVQGRIVEYDLLFQWGTRPEVVFDTDGEPKAKPARKVA